MCAARIGLNSFLTAALLAAIWLGAATVAEAQSGNGTALTEKSLGAALESIGLKPQKVETRYDFRFKTNLQGQEWDLTMSAVLSNDGEAVWMMAWLDELPTSSGDVTKSALLRLLSRNDEMGNGKFFAYIPSNRRFVLQRIVPNRDLDARALAAVLQDIGLSVKNEYPNWAVANWKSAQPAVPPPADTAINDPKFNGTSRN